MFVAPPNNKTLSSCTSNPYSLASHNSPQGMVLLLWKGFPVMARSSLNLSVPLPASAQLHPVRASKSSSSLLFSESLDQGGSGSSSFDDSSYTSCPDFLACTFSAQWSTIFPHDYLEYTADKALTSGAPSAPHSEQLGCWGQVGSTN